MQVYIPADRLVLCTEEKARVPPSPPNPVTGRPSFRQVKVGGGAPVAAQVNVKGRPMKTTLAMSPVVMTGGRTVEEEEEEEEQNSRLFLVTQWPCPYLQL